MLVCSCFFLFMFFLVFFLPGGGGGGGESGHFLVFVFFWLVGSRGGGGCVFFWVSVGVGVELVVPCSHLEIYFVGFVLRL